MTILLNGKQLSKWSIDDFTSLAVDPAFDIVVDGVYTGYGASVPP